MDEEKQQDGMMKKTGDALKKGAKKQAKNFAKKIIKKVVMMIASFVLKIILPIIIAIVIITAIADFLDFDRSEDSKTANAFAVKYTSGAGDFGGTSGGGSGTSGSTSGGGSGTSGSTSGGGSGTSNDTREEESSLNSIIVDVNNVKNGAYELKYEFRDKDGNPYSEEQAITNIKSDLLKKNEDLDLTKFSPSELKIIGVLMYNGLMVEDCNEEELKAIALFVKADIASQSFDLRSSDKIGEEIDLEQIDGNDYVYGTLQIHRTKAAEGYDSETPLEFIPYGDENTPGTFCYMEKNSDINIMSKFSIDYEGNVVFAKSSTVTTTYVYKDENKRELSVDEISQNIPEENIFEDENKTFITATPFNYKQHIAGYTINYGFLSDLLIITDNVEFCLELAQLAFNGKIVINVKEELSITDSTRTTTYTQTKLLYDYVSYEISGQKEVETSVWEKEIAETGNPNNSENLKDEYGWSSTYKPVSTEGNLYQGTSTYQWTYENVNYKLEHTYTTSSSSWILYKENINVTYEDLPVLGGKNELINLNNIKEENEGYTIDENYTKQDVFVYTIEETSHAERNSCSYEISELDCWYLKYHKKYEEPEVKPLPVVNNTTSIKGKYPKEATEVLTTANVDEINKYQEVKDYISNKENEYKNNNSAATVESVVNGLTIKEKIKIDEEGNYVSNTKEYKFGEEVADTTEAQEKNIEYINSQPVFTNENSEEIGFLYIYDKYTSQGIDLYLKNDAEKRLFELLENDLSTYQYSNVLRYLLFVYDEIDRGVSSLNLKIVDIQGANKVKGTSTENYIKAWENGGLWAYETGQSSIFPTGYLTDDELSYIVYEDGSSGHNNIAYGICTFISSSTNVEANNSDWGDGYYNWVEEFASEGISVEDLYEGAYVDKAIADAIFNNILKENINDVESYLQTNLPEYKFTRAQKDALVAIKYQYGNISGFADAYLACLNEDGTIDAEKLKEEYSRFNYSSTVNDRKYANWLLFAEGTYIDREGNKIITRMSLDNWDEDYYSNNDYTFPVYNQYDGRWGSYTFGGTIGKTNGKTISSSGCGCCSLAAILSGYLGELITPDILTQRLDEVYPSGNYYELGQGSCHFYFWDPKLLDEFGCSGRNISSKADAIEALKSGYAVIGGEDGHLLAYVPVSSEDAALGYVFRIIDSARGHNVLCRNFADADAVVDGDAGVIAVIYPPGT